MIKKIIDLRSDTVTKPTQGMLNEMFKAEVGDDVFNEDPSVIELENKVAQMFGHQSALFCPSGTMTNQIAINVHTKSGDEVICDELSHIYHYENAGVASNSGVQIKLLKGENGCLTANQIGASINSDFDWLPRTALISLENTGNKAGGSYYSLDAMSEISKLSKKLNIPLHLDGARFFNAGVAAGYKAIEVGPLFNSLSICLSKGLGAPVGSLLIGNKSFIKEARRVRKRWGGGMRQVGYLAKAGIFALDHHIQRLADDHKRAKEIERFLFQMPYVNSILPVKTNIVIFELTDRLDVFTFINKLEASQIKAVPFGPRSIRFVTHLDFTEEHLQDLKKALKQIN
jgi:threonine aldolase